LRERRIFVRETEGQQVGFLLADLSGMELDAIKTEEDGTSVACKVKLDTEDLVSLAFPDGEWHTLTIKTPWTAKMRGEVESALKTMTAMGQTVRNGERYNAVFLGKAVETWTLKDKGGNLLSVSEESISNLSDSLVDTLHRAVSEVCYPAVVTGQDFFSPLKLN